LSSSEENPSS